MLQGIINIKKYQYMYNCLERPPKWSLKRGYFTYFMKSCDIFSRNIENNIQKVSGVCSVGTLNSLNKRLFRT
jgi:hypothetical protein